MASPTRKVTTAHCPECDTVIRFSKQPELGELVTCQECNAVLEVVDLSPLELDWAYDAYDDDDDSWDDWDEDENDYDEDYDD